MSGDLEKLAKPTFVSVDASARLVELISWYEAATGKTLYPAQPERLLIDLIAYADNNVRTAMQLAGEQNLLAFADGAALENLAAFFGVTRLAGEDDEALRKRVSLAPESFSVAGSRGAYKYWAMSADASISDVAVISPAPGVVCIYPLTKTGLPTQAIINSVIAVCSAETVRPLCDTVEVASPSPVSFSISATVEPYMGFDGDLARQNAEAAVVAWAKTVSETLGRDVVKSQIIAALSVAGVYRVTLHSPSSDRVLDVHEWATCTSITVALGGVAHG